MPTPRAIPAPNPETATRLLSSPRNAAATTDVIPRLRPDPDEAGESGYTVVKRRGVETPLIPRRGRALARRVREQSTLRYSALRSARLAVLAGGFVAVGMTLGMLASGAVPGGHRLLETFDLISVAEEAPGGPGATSPDPAPARGTPALSTPPPIRPVAPGEFPIEQGPNGEVTIPSSITAVTPLPGFPPPPSWWNCSGRCASR